ncbi:DNA helicase RecQ [Sphingobacteriales bacterium UPWRP_1]|nr:DNA helicase RecQ [Sphingobacteriales bacterium UPWRP_1]
MQAEIIEAVLNRQHVLVIMPTGGGKSVCFQIPALIMPGIGVVVSPLIALMKDQVEALRQNGVPAVYLNSSQSPAEQRAIEEACHRGEVKLLYVSPEKMQTDWFQSFLQALPVNLFAIDEAHCISFWGHDFRPEYSQLRVLRQRFANVPVVALTATADKLTRSDIMEQLQLQNPRIFISSFDRPNLSLAVLPALDRVQHICRFLEQAPNQSGIIYCLSRKGTETLAEKLRLKGFNAAAYHAGMDTNERHRVQDAFLRDRIRVVCATIAFGMGIDKSNVRFVLHYNLPKNIESYYQEIGRAGRDGLPGKTVLFYSYADVQQHLQMIEEENGTRKELKIAKLKLLQHFAEAQICRRRILLNYFGQQTDSNCGNCDVCRHPRKQFNGTIIAQKALSAVARLQQNAPMSTVVDVLRGVRSATVLKHGYDRVKTFGAGNDLKFPQWMDYLIQLMQLGYLEMAFNQNNALKLTEASQKVLYGGQTVTLVQVSAQDTEEQKREARQNAKPKTQQEIFTETLFERLRMLRKQLADEQEVPAYVVFTDATLQEMANLYPLTQPEMLKINGVSMKKMAAYGHRFMDTIAHFLRTDGKNFKPATRQVSFAFYLQHPQNLQFAAQERQLQPATIAKHLAELYEEGYPVQINHLVTNKELQEIVPVIEELGTNTTMRPVFDKLEGRFGYDKIAAALAFFRRNGSQTD